MKTRIGILVKVLLIAGILLCLSISFAQEGIDKTESLSKVIKQLSGENKDVRLKATGALDSMRETLKSGLLGIIETSKESSWHGAKHLAILQIGKWRISDAIPNMVKLINWRVKSPNYKKVPAWAKFPCACALKEIGGKEVRTAILKKISISKDEEILRLSAWILNKIDGEAIAKQVIQNAKEQPMSQIKESTFSNVIKYIKDGDKVFVGIKK